MKTAHIRWNKDIKGEWSSSLLEGEKATLIFVFGEGEAFLSPLWYEKLKILYPCAQIVGCSTAGNILDETLSDGDVVGVVCLLERSTIKIVNHEIGVMDDPLMVGKSLASKLMGEGLKHIFLLSDGLNVNGSGLAQGFNDVCAPMEVSVSGGLAGDGVNFAKTFTVSNGLPKEKSVVAIGFYGDIEIKTGCKSGWDEFGTNRIVTRSVGNVVYEIDGEKALDLYKKYLGDDAKNLPSSGLKFPLSITTASGDHLIIRTLLAVNENDKSLTFAGDVPQGCTCRLMKTNIDKLITYAGDAAVSAKSDFEDDGLCLAISCVGRRLVLGQLVEEELEILRKNLGSTISISGFYSYGEIAPTVGLLECELHNQTMTVTTFREF